MNGFDMQNHLRNVGWANPVIEPPVSTYLIIQQKLPPRLIQMKDLKVNPINHVKNLITDADLSIGLPVGDEDINTNLRREVEIKRHPTEPTSVNNNQKNKAEIFGKLN
ncbi:hypothetical protein OnM2_054068 [Erysiphe neolycopersici]|uniref:Uncharacterized protein n=1 Tax=Erysiphe neolycopersici TaxID=212602 RepID=A0A420HRN5_9PEZI|nr:hypothetical protein OnM2_054068 [Erysiphe neolycopersici]